MAEKSKPTLRDIAKMTGLSTATVSMVLSGRGSVPFAPETVRRVTDAARQLHYVKPRPTGQAMHIFRHKTVAIVNPTISNPYYSALIQSIEQIARLNRFQTFVCNTYRDAAVETSILDMLQNTDIAGVIFTAIPFSGKLVEEFNRSVPVVVIGDRNKEADIDTVEVDNYKAGVIVAKHLIGLGHRHIAFISTTLSQNNTARVRRMEGMQDTFRRECPGGSILVKSRAVSPQDDLDNLTVEHAVGSALTRECLPQKKITAFAAVNDMVAYGIMDALHAENYRIPQDYSVCGFDNIFPSQLSSLPLTTVEHAIQEKGHDAFSLLYSKIGSAHAPGAPHSPITRIEYQPRLIVRGTTAPPRAEA